MQSHLFHKLAMTLVAGSCVAAGAPDAAELPGLNRKMLAFAREKVGRQVGDGECFTFALAALRAAGARAAPSPDGGFVWGEPVAVAEPGRLPAARVLPGDVAQFADTRFEWAPEGGGRAAQVAVRHTAVVTSADGGTLAVLHQNWGGKVRVHAERFRLGCLAAGRVLIYRPVPGDGVGWPGPHGSGRCS